MSRLAQADRAGMDAATEAPRALTASEKAVIARLCREVYDSDDQAIADTIEDCEGCPAFRAYLLTLGGNYGKDQ